MEGLTGSVDGLEQLMTQADVLLLALLRLIAGDSATSKAALHSLINLSQVEGSLQRPRSALETDSTMNSAQLYRFKLSLCRGRMQYGSWWSSRWWAG